MIIKYITAVFILITAFGAKAQTLNYYFGNIHAHSGYSDGNKDSTTSGMSTPLEDFQYAKNSQHIDFYGISEHNHYSAGLTNPAHYHQGIADANATTVNGTFIAMYGMEWGVISGGGHAIVYGYDSLIGWDNNDYDIYVAEGDYANLWKKVNDKLDAFAYLAHPQTDDYDNMFANAVNLQADNAIVGMAARSGPAFSTNNAYSDPSTSNYINRYNDALKRGYHVGVGLDHDTHNSVFGRQTHGRLVVMAPALTRTDIMQAMRKMCFYSSDDWNTKVNFTIAAQPIGSIITHSGTPTLSVSISDDDNEAFTSIQVYYGIPGSGTAPTVLNTASNSSTLTYTHNIANNSTYYYYLKITQADGDIIWTSPIWYTRSDVVTNNPPVAAFTPSQSSTCVGTPVTFTDNSANGPSEWHWSLPGALPDTSTNQNLIVSYNTPGTYTVYLTATNQYGANTSVAQTITVNPLPSVIALSDTICKGQVDTLTATGAATWFWSTAETTQTIYVAPTTTTLYSVTGTALGCSKTVFVTVTVEDCTGIEEALQNAVKVYPNPANDYLTIDAGILTGKKTIQVFDVFGKLVLAETTTDVLHSVDLTTLTSGTYIVKIATSNTVYTAKQVVVNRN